MKTIPTAEEFLENHYKKIREHFLTFHNGNYDSYEEYNKSNPLKTLQECMIEFAKLHVEQALKEASEKATMKVEYPDEGVRRVEIKLNQSNEISILTEQKQMFSREEVTELLRLAWATASTYGENTNEADCIDWINHNLH